MPNQNPWIVCPEPHPSPELRLICFSHAGGGVAAFRGWSVELRDVAEVSMVQLPARESRIRERPYTTITDLLPPLVDSLADLVGIPFAFYGHSLGARIAFEVARALRRTCGKMPVQLFAGACPAPHLSWAYPVTHKLGELEFLREIQTRYGGVPQQVLSDPDLRALLLPTLRADIAILETAIYSDEPPLDCPISVFGGLQDPMVKTASLAAWRTQTTGAFDLRMFRGDHFFNQASKPQLLDAIASKLRPAPLAFDAPALYRRAV